MPRVSAHEGFSRPGLHRAYSSLCSMLDNALVLFDIAAARPKGVKLELDARDYTRYSPRVNTHDHSTGRPVAEDYYR